MRVTLQLTPAAAQRVHSRTRSLESGPLPWLEHHLVATHPDTSDPALATFFTIDVEDGSAAAGLLQRLRHDPAVQAAYIKPDDEPA